MANKHIRRFDRDSLALVVSAAIVVAVLGAGLFTRPGPEWFWMSDACPNRPGVCGMVPLGPVLLAAVAAGLVGVANRVIRRGE